MYVVLARALGVEDYGVFIYAFTWVNVLLLVGRLGTDLSIVRFLSPHIHAGDWPRARGVLRVTHLAVGAATLALGCLSGAVVYAGLLAGEQYRNAFLLGLLSMPLLGLSMLRQGALRSVRAFLLAEIPDGLIRPLLLIAILGGVWLVAPHVSAGDAMLCYFVANVGTLIVGSFWLWRALPAQIWASHPVFEVRHWLVVSVQLMLHSGVFHIMQQVDVLMLGILAGPDDVARYSAASRMSWFVSFGAIAMSSIAAPLIARHHAERDLNGVQAVVSSATRKGFAFAAGVWLALCLLGPLLLTLFGRDFATAYPLLVLLVSAQLVNAFWSLGSYVMIMMERQRELIMITLAALLMTVALNMLLIPVWEDVGAAIAKALTIIAFAGAVFIYCWKALHVRAWPF